VLQSRSIKFQLYSLSFTLLCNSSHTCTVVRECFKGDEASQRKRPKFDPSPHHNSLTDLHKNWQAWLRPGWHQECKNFIAIGSGGLLPKYMILPCLWGD